jgi:hypothetical protein
VRGPSVPEGGSIRLTPTRARREVGRRARQDRYWASKAGPVATGRLLARTESACWFCALPIRVGDPIALYVSTAADKWWGHSDCVQAARRSDPGPAM